MATVQAVDPAPHRERGPRRLGRIVLVAVVAIALAGGWFLWRLLDVESLFGTAEIVALPDGGAAVAWADYSSSPPKARLVVVDADGRQVSAEELENDRNVVGMAVGASGIIAVAENATLAPGSITLLETGAAGRRDLVRPASVPYGIGMLVTGNELLWTSRRDSGGALEATDLTTGRTRMLATSGNSGRDLTALSDRRTVALLDDGTVVLVDVASGESRGRVGDGRAVAMAATGDGIAFVTKDGEPKVLEQCPGDSGPGTDGELRVGRLWLWRGGKVVDLGVDLAGQQATGVTSIPGSDQLLVSAVKADGKGCPGAPSLHRVDVASKRHDQVVSEYDYSVEASPSGKEIAYLHNGSLFIASLSGGPAERLTPSGTEALSGFAWTRDGSLWFVSDMAKDRKSRGEPRLWLKRPGVGVAEPKGAL